MRQRGGVTLVLWEFSPLLQPNLFHGSPWLPMVALQLFQLPCAKQACDANVSCIYCQFFVQNPPRSILGCPQAPFYALPVAERACAVPITLLPSVCGQQKLQPCQQPQKSILVLPIPVFQSDTVYTAPSSAGSNFEHTTRNMYLQTCRHVVMIIGNLN